VRILASRSDRFWITRPWIMLAHPVCFRLFSPIRRLLVQPASGAGQHHSMNSIRLSFRHPQNDHPRSIYAMPKISLGYPASEKKEFHQGGKLNPNLVIF
jgi:hypothetical protein